MKSGLAPYDLAHPDYDRWLIANRTKDAATGELLRMLPSRDARMESYQQWRMDRCNPVVEYTDKMDRLVLDAVVAHLEERINFAWSDAR